MTIRHAAVLVLAFSAAIGGCAGSDPDDGAQSDESAIHQEADAVCAELQDETTVEGLRPAALGTSAEAREMSPAVADEQVGEPAQTDPPPPPTPRGPPCDRSYPAGSFGASYCATACVIDRPPGTGTTPHLANLENLLLGPRVPRPLVAPDSSSPPRPIDIQCTDDDIQRPPACPAPPGTSSQPNPSGVAQPIFGPDGSVTGCSIRIECGTVPPRLLYGKLLHELCHCADYFDNTQTSEAGADACAARVARQLCASGFKPPTPPRR